MPRTKEGYIPQFTAIIIDLFTYYDNIMIF